MLCAVHATHLAFRLGQLPASELIRPMATLKPRFAIQVADQPVQVGVLVEHMEPLFGKDVIELVSPQQRAAAKTSSWLIGDVRVLQDVFGVIANSCKAVRIPFQRACAVNIYIMLNVMRLKMFQCFSFAATRTWHLLIHRAVGYSAGPSPMCAAQDPLSPAPS